jgi:hypothetical protein
VAEIVLDITAMEPGVYVPESGETSCYGCANRSIAWCVASESRLLGYELQLRATQQTGTRIARVVQLKRDVMVFAELRGQLLMPSRKRHSGLDNSRLA